MKLKKTLAALLAGALMLTGCGEGSDPGNGAAEGGSTLVIAIQDEIEGGDIQQIGWDNVVHQLIYEPLVTFSSDLGEILPSFAESFEESADGLEITFHLYADSKFANGDPLTAESVKKSVERMKEISEYAGDVEAIKEVQVVDEHTVKYILSQPAPYMWSSLASSYGGVVDVDKAEEMGRDEFNRNPVGNGPYLLEDWQAGSQVVLKKNPYYRTSNPNVKNHDLLSADTIIVRFIPDEFTRISELEAGNIDVVFDVPAANVADLKENPDVTTYSYKQAGANYMMFQTEDGPAADSKIRQAINIGIDRDALADALDNVIAPQYGFISDAQAGFSSTKETEYASKYKFDPKGAKKLLAEAGYTDSNGDGFVDKNGANLTIEYASPTDKASGKAAAPVIQAQLKALGVDFQIREYEQSYIKQLVRDNKFQAASRNYLWNDADILYYVFTEASGYPWHHDAVTDALTKARYETDPDARVKAYEKAQDALFAQIPAVAFFADNYCIATSSNVKNLVVTNDGRVFFNDVTKE